MENKFQYAENPQLTEDENESGREYIEDFNDMFNTTCRIMSTFKGKNGHKVVDAVVSMIKSTPELQQFLYEFYYNTRIACRVSSIYNED